MTVPFLVRADLRLVVVRLVVVRLAVVLALVALPVLSGCGASDGGHADVAFATGMVPHHRQAVQVSDLLLAKTGVDGDVRDLATRIRSEQAPEIEQLSGWLRDWGEPVPPGTPGAGMGGTGSTGGMDMPGDGMMTPAELDALTTASGAHAQRLFLQEMIRHHTGAVAMARTEQEQGRNAAAKRLASSIVSSQQAEIDQMDRLLTG